MDEALERGRPLYIALVDLEKAFDRVDRAALLAVMRHYGWRRSTYDRPRISTLPPMPA